MTHLNAWFETYFATIDTKKLIMNTYLDGYNTFEDYEKYGDAFIRVEKINDTVLVKFEEK